MALEMQALDPVTAISEALSFGAIIPAPCPENAGIPCCVTLGCRLSQDPDLWNNFPLLEEPLTPSREKSGSPIPRHPG